MKFRRWVLALCFMATAATAQTTLQVPSLATPTIQSGIDAAKDGDSVLVGPGVYNENIDFKGKAITVTSSAAAAATIIDGGGRSATVSFHSQENVTSVLSGFTIRNGGPTASLTTIGGGVYINNAAPTVTNNVITANACNGVTVAAAYVHLIGNTISGTLASNSASCFVSGSGLASYGTVSGFLLNGTDSYSEIFGNTIESNVQATIGGGIYGGGNFRIRNNIIRNNIAGDGSAVYDGDAEFVWFSQNVVYGNDSNGSSTYQSAITLIDLTGGSLGAFVGEFFNNTIANNSATAVRVKSTEVYMAYAHPDLLFANNIIVGSTKNAAIGCGSPRDIYDAMTFNHNDIYNAVGPATVGGCIEPTGQYGNIAADPQFVSSASFNYHLNNTSPAIDVGQTIDLQEANSYRGLLLPPYDFDGNPRIQDATGKGYAISDMGAYEFPGVTDVAQTAMALSPSNGPNGFATNYEQSSDYPQPFPLTALLASSLGVPTGSVNFYSDGVIFDTQPIGSDGAAVTNTKALIPGVHVMWASYAGQGTFSPTDAPAFLIDVSRYTPTLTLTSSVNPSLVGQPVTFTVQITSDINQLGPIYLVDGPTTLATLTPDSTGKATYTTSTLTLGSHQITASYQGDATHNKASATLTQQVVNYYPTSMTISSSVNPSTVGQPVTFSAQVSSVSGVPAGSITFSDGATVIATVAVDSTGKASTTTSALTLGNHTISASYAQTGTFAASSASLTQQVIVGTSITTLSVMPASGVYGTSVTMTATVTGNPPSSTVPTGSVSFYSNGTLLAKVTLANGAASFSTATLSGGTDTITCTYSGDSNFQGSTCTGMPVTISSTTSSMTLTGTPNPAAPSTVITFTATLMANGTPLVVTQVTFTIDGTVIGTKTTSATGSVIYKSPGLDPGQHTVVATFAGNSSASGSSAIFIEDVLAPTNTQLVVSPTSTTYGGSVGMTATVTSTSSSAAGLIPTGTVSFSNNGNALATVGLSNGVANFSTSALPPGMDSITCAYSGDTNFSVSSCNTVVVTVGAATPALTLVSSANPTNALIPVSFTAALGGNGSPIAGVGIAFTVDGTSVGAINTNAQGVAVYTSTGLNVGPHVITASFSGNASYGAQSASLTEQVNGIPTATSLSVTPNPGTQGQAVNFSITVASLVGTTACGGTVVLLDGSTQISRLPLVPSNSSAVATATVSTNSLTPGFHQIQAMYVPADGNCLTSASAVEAVNIVAPGLTLSATPASITIQTEHYGSLAITVTSIANFVGSVQLSCGSSLPTFVTCTFDRSQLSLSANGTASSKLTLNTDAVPYFKSRLDSPSHGNGHQQSWLAVLFPFSILTLIGLSKPRRIQTALSKKFALVALIGLLTAVGMVGCGSQYPAHATPGTYSIPITATGTSMGATTPASQTLNITLIVTE